MNIKDNFFLVWPFAFSPICLNVTFELTYLCNLNCPFCYLRKEAREKRIKQKKILCKDAVLKVIDKVPKLTAITFTGGEVFLIKDILEILKYAKKNHRVGLISNLTLNSSKINKALVDLEINSLMFSLDGDKKFHDKMRGRGNFKKTINNIFQIQQIKEKEGKKTPRLTMNTVIMPGNVSILERVVEIAADLKVDYLNFQLLDSSLERSGYRLHNSLDHLTSNLSRIVSIKEKDLEVSLKKASKKAKDLNLKLTLGSNFDLKQAINYYQKKVDLRDFYCSKIFTYTKISPQGEMYPCYNLRIGSILKSNFYQLYNSRKYQNLRRLVQKGSLAASCLGCCHFKLKK